MAPPRLAPRSHSLPPMLHRRSPNAMPNCSKALRGLFVLLRVTRIFTRSSISPGPSSRQCPSRYAIRAGRNFARLPYFYGRRLYLDLVPRISTYAGWIHLECIDVHRHMLVEEIPAFDSGHSLECRPPSRLAPQSLRGQSLQKQGRLPTVLPIS